MEEAIATGTIAGAATPSDALPLLTAQLIRRRQERPAPDDSYLNLRGDRRHLEILIDARRDLDLPIDGRNLRDDYLRHPTRPLCRLGLKITRLT